MKTWKRYVVAILAGTVLGSASKFFPTVINAGIISFFTTLTVLQTLRVMIPERRKTNGNTRESDR